MLDVKNIGKSFHRKEVLTDISFSINPGEIYGLLGPNGAGKTTLIRIINRIVQQDCGVIRIQGDLMTQRDLNNIGYLPEERGLYKSMTVERHTLFIGMLRGLSKRDVRAKMDFWFKRFEINDWRKKRIEELSKGMAQKIQFICAVLHEPKLLILDEPFSGFDPINIELIKQELLEMRAADKSIILSTHNMKSVEEICDRAVLLNNGRIIVEGKISELRENQKQGLYAVRFRGNMISFVNALWTGFEIVDKDILGDDRFVVRVAMRQENSFDDLLQVLLRQVKIEAAWEVLPSMQDIFIDLVQPKENLSDEE